MPQRFSPLFRPLNEVEEYTTFPGNYLSLSFTVGARTTLVIRKTDKLSDVLSYQESAAQHKTGNGTYTEPYLGIRRLLEFWTLIT